MTDQDAALRLLKKILEDQPRLDGAACIGRPELFDPVDPEAETPSFAEARQAQALALCAGCPVLAACAEFAEGERQLGQVLAGRVRHPDKPVRRGGGAGGPEAS